MDQRQVLTSSRDKHFSRNTIRVQSTFFLYYIYLFNSAAIKTYKINLAHIKRSYFIPSFDLFFVPDTKYTMAELFPWLYNNVLLCHNSWFGIYSSHPQKKKKKKKKKGINSNNSMNVPEPFQQT